jgi:hypothetical protein
VEREEGKMRTRSVAAICFALLTLTYQAFAGKKVEFNATVRADVACELGYRIVHVNKKKGATDEYCAIGPKAAALYLEQNVDKEVNIKGHDGIQTHDGDQVLVLWIDKVGGTKVPDYNPCQISTASAILGGIGAGLGGQMPQLPPGCTGVGDSSQSEANSGVPAAQDTGSTQSDYPSQQGIQQSVEQTYDRGLNQCTRTQYDPSVAALYIVNSCNVAVTVDFTSNSGNAWGEANIGPNSRGSVATFGMGYDPRRDGAVWLFTCPKGDTPVMPGGNPWMSHNYRGDYLCLHP